MKKKLLSFFTILTVLIAFTVFTNETVSAKVANGTYKVNYEIKEANSENTSIADGYFVKPATLVVENGKNTIQFTVTNSDWIKSLSGPNGKVTVVSENKANNTRVVKFTAGDINRPIQIKMHIVVPEKEAGMKYDHEHTARMVIDTSGLKMSTSTAEKNTSEKSTNDSGATKGEENPPTGDNNSFMLYALLLLVSGIALIIVKRFRPNQN